MPTEALISASRRQFMKVCLHPDAGQGRCNAIIDAHTVQRARTLQKLVDANNHVLTFYPAKHDANGLLQIHSRGWKKASTFTGFCGIHDMSTFAPLENKDFEFSTEVAFLLSYRALCHELYQKKSAARSYSDLRQMLDRGQLPDTQIVIQNEVAIRLRGFARAINGLEEAKIHADRSLLTKNYEGWSFACLEFSGELSLATAGAPTPTADLDGRRLQSLHDSATPIQHLYLSIVSSRSGAAVVFGWRKDHPAPRHLVESLLSIPRPLLAGYVVQYVFAHLENVCFARSWWNSIAPESQLHLHRLAGITSPYYSTPVYVESEFLPWKLMALHRCREA